MSPSSPSRASTLALLSLTVLGCGSAGEQLEWADIADTSSVRCDSCSIQLAPIAVLDAGSLPDGEFTIFSRPLRLRDGGWLVSATGDGSRMTRFDPEHRPVEAIGRRGEGPGEYANIQGIFLDAGDSIIVVDRRVTKLDPAGRFLRSAALTDGIRPLRGVGIRPDRLLLNNFGPGGPPFVMLNDSLRPSGAAGEPSSNPDELKRAVAASGDGGWWAAGVGPAQSIHRYTAGGELVDSVAPAAPWWFGPEGVRPGAVVSGLGQSADGHLWVLVTVPNILAWEDRARANPMGAERPMPSLAEFQRLYDSWIEVVEARSGQVVAARMYPGLLAGMTPAGELYEVFEDRDSGRFLLRILRGALPSQRHHLSRSAVEKE